MPRIRDRKKMDLSLPQSSFKFDILPSFVLILPTKEHANRPIFKLKIGQEIFESTIRRY